MQTPLQLSFHNMEPSDFIEAEVRRRVAKLEQFSERIVACRVAVEADNQRHHKDHLYRVSILLTVPGGDVVVNRSPGDIATHVDVYVAIRDAFRAARRQLEDRERVQRAQVKSHVEPPEGRVSKLFATGYGFIEAPEGREIYFHENAVLHGKFDTLRVGDRVRYAEEEGIDGPQASTVVLVAHVEE